MTLMINIIKILESTQGYLPISHEIRYLRFSNYHMVDTSVGVSFTHYSVPRHLHGLLDIFMFFAIYSS
jgi:hypothetical protein